MRFPESKIKDAILHRAPDIRERATRYFAGSHSQDDSLMALVIEAVQMYGRRDSYQLIGPSRDLPQTAESIAWVIDELNDDQSEKYESYVSNLSMVLIGAEPALLASQASSILESRHFRSSLHRAFTERLTMQSWGEADCWRKLEEFCEDGNDDEFTSEVDWSHAFRIVDALARHGQACEGRVNEYLSQKLTDDDQSPMSWMTPLAARLAGLAHLDTAVPLLINKLREDGENILNEQCAEALGRIGSPAVVQALADAFPSAPDHFRLAACDTLECIRSDLVVETCVRLLERERKTMVRECLTHTLLSQFAQEGIEAARQLLKTGELKWEAEDLRDFLLETCTITGDRFPEFDDWQAERIAEKELHKKTIEEIGGDRDQIGRAHV